MATKKKKVSFQKTLGEITRKYQGIEGIIQVI